MKSENKKTVKKEVKKLTPEMKAELAEKEMIKDVHSKVKAGEEKRASKPKAAEKEAVILEPKVKGKDLKKSKEKKAKKEEYEIPPLEKKPKATKVLKDSKKKKTPKGLSNIKIAEQLLADEATEKVILLRFTKVYEGKDVTDVDFIAKRAKIYMEIAKKNANKS